MKLTDNEIRDITKHLEAGKPLPEKYRFLLFEEKREVELVWNGKTGEVCNIVLPFQVIEQVDEPRSEKEVRIQGDLFNPSTGRQIKGWTNKLIWGDNKLILSSLKNGPLREEIEKQGGIKLIYIDPPFDVGADFSMDIEIGPSTGSGQASTGSGQTETFTKKPNIMEELAYRDTWGKGADSFIAMIYERLALMRDLLAEDGSIYVHIDYRLVAPLRLILDEIFGTPRFINEIIWKRGNHKKTEKMYLISHDNVLVYSKSGDYIFNPQFSAYDKDYLDKYYGNIDSDGRRYQLQGMYGKGSGPALYFGERLISPPKGLHWRWAQERITEALNNGIIVFPRGGDGMPRFKDYLDDKQGVPVRTIWDDVYEVNSQATERIDYPTQKPESLLERIIKASSNEGDLVADFFCGSGTTAAVAEKLGRKWITSDLGKFAVHTARKRMIGVQRELKKDGKPYRAFEILNLGKYERQHYIGIDSSHSFGMTEKGTLGMTTEDSSVASLLRNDKKGGNDKEGRNDKGRDSSHSLGMTNNADTSTSSSVISTEGRNLTRQEMQQRMIEEKEAAFLDLILHAYRAEKTEGFRTFHGKKAGRLVAVGPVNMPVTRLFVEEIILECRKKQITKVDILAFEFEMGLFPNVLDEAKAKGIDISPKYIPADVFDKRAVEKNQVVFHDVSFIEVKPIFTPLSSPLGKGGLRGVAVELTDFSVFYSQDSIAAAEASLKDKGSKIVVEKGQIVKVSKDKDGVISREVLTKHWTDWIDYWSVDFDFESKREIIRVQNAETGEWEEVWTGDYVFENEWQSFRTKKDRSIELKSVFQECPPGRHKIAVKVVDIFGNDTMKIVEVRV